MVFKSFNSSSSSVIIVFPNLPTFSFFESSKERDIFGICLDLAPKSLYLFSKSEKKVSIDSISIQLQRGTE